VQYFYSGEEASAGMDDPGLMQTYAKEELTLNGTMGYNFP